MADVEIYIGSVGPFLVDESDPILAKDGQVVRVNQLASFDTAVVSETSFGQSAAVGTSTKMARADHTHGTPANPLASGLTQDVTVVTSIGPPEVTATLHFTNGILTSVT